MKTGRLIVPGVLALAAVFSSGAAARADEARTAPDSGHHVTLLSIGQIDDPMEDVLEHVSLLGSNEVNGS
ncbi:hypothetical protein [Streptomyces sp. NPDC051310]|uniref:hypothetical protein n=1 Tax=Streptomyces sp. NPDC051310 TaxID=3365649 RepID=UPI00378ED583